MIIKAAREYSIDLENSFMVGDKWSDVEAGIRAGCRTIRITSVTNLHDLHNKFQPDHAATNLSEAVEYILNHQNKNHS